jgi:hypothetical protein
MVSENKNSSIKVLDSKSKNFLIAIAIGRKTLNDWQNYAKPGWIKYCKKHKLGIIVITKDLIEKKSRHWKKATWQKWLIGSYLQKKYSNKINNICYLDIDILINPLAPNVFKFHDVNKISVVSMVNNLPYNLQNTRKKIAYSRNKFYSKKYPLDSVLFMPVKKIYEYHNLAPQKDFFCSGMFVINIKKFAKSMSDWFFKYTRDIKSITGDGDQVHTNYEVFKNKQVKILDYKFQALWPYELVNKFPFLYDKKIAKKKLIKVCVEKTLLENYFLHFAGKWEDHMWKIKNILSDKTIKSNEKFIKYLKKKSYGKPLGRILPKW